MAKAEPSLRDARVLLGLSADATPAQVVSAFRRLARVEHPDISTARTAPHRFAALVAAYDVALRASHQERPTDPEPGVPRPTINRVDTPLSRGIRDLVTHRAGTTIWQGGRAVMSVGPVVQHLPPSPRGGPDPSGRGTRE